jgi:hypothetical protein
MSNDSAMSRTNSSTSSGSYASARSTLSRQSSRSLSRQSSRSMSRQSSVRSNAGSKPAGLKNNTSLRQRVRGVLGASYDALDKAVQLKFKGGLEEMVRYNFAMYSQAAVNKAINKACNIVPVLGRGARTSIHMLRESEFVQKCMRPVLAAGRGVASVTSKMLETSTSAVIHKYLVNMLLRLTGFEKVVQYEQVAALVRKNQVALTAMLAGRTSGTTLRDAVLQFADLPTDAKLKEWVNAVNIPIVLTGAPGNKKKAQNTVASLFVPQAAAAGPQQPSVLLMPRRPAQLRRTSSLPSTLRRQAHPPPFLAEARRAKNATQKQQQQRARIKTFIESNFWGQ